MKQTNKQEKKSFAVLSFFLFFLFLDSFSPNKRSFIIISIIYNISCSYLFIDYCPLLGVILAKREHKVQLSSFFQHIDRVRFTAQGYFRGWRQWWWHSLHCRSKCSFRPSEKKIHSLHFKYQACNELPAFAWNVSKMPALAYANTAIGHSSTSVSH